MAKGDVKPLLGDSSPLSKEQQREIHSKGGKASAKVQAQKRKEKEEWLRLLNMTLHEGKAERVKNLAEAKKANAKLDTAMKIRIIQETLKKGDINTYIKILSLAGLLDPDPPEITKKEEQEENAFLKALNDSAAEVWKDEANEEN